MHIYLASPLGFSPELTSYKEKIITHLTSNGHTVCDPWKESEAFVGEISEVHTATTVADQIARAAAVATKIGFINIEAIRSADIVLAILDGSECDSGTVAELGFSVGLGKPAYGLRTDFRNVGELPGLPVNLQVMAFIEMSGGKMVRSIEEIHFPNVDKIVERRQLKKELRFVQDVQASSVMTRLRESQGLVRAIKVR